MRRYLEAGRLNAPRGLKGEVRFSCWCDSMEFLSGVKKLYLDPEGKAYLEVEKWLVHLGTVVFKGYGDRTSASSLTGRTLWFDREDVPLPPGGYFNDDLIGTPVFDLRTERTVGRVLSVEERGGQVLWEIGDGEKTFLFPPAPAYLVSVRPGEEIRVNLIDGFAPGTEG